MKGLKSLVFGMGLLIVVGLGLVGYGLSRGKTAGLDRAAEQAAPQPQPLQSIKTAYFNADLPLPRGCHLQSVSATSDRILLHVSGAEGGDRILLLDPHNGQLLGSISVAGEGH